jgi:antitoxin ParD1/3/4
MTSAVAGILQSIEGLSLPEQQELIVALCDRAVIDEPLEWAIGADPNFADLDRTGKRELLRQKLLSGLEQVQQGRVVDGEVVFDRLQAKLRRMSEQQA